MNLYILGGVERCSGLLGIVWISITQEESKHVLDFMYLPTKVYVLNGFTCILRLDFLYKLSKYEYTCIISLALVLPSTLYLLLILLSLFVEMNVVLSITKIVGPWVHIWGHKDVE